MRRVPIPLDHAGSGIVRRPSLLRCAAIVFASALLAPVLAEGGAICYAQWSEVFGKPLQVDTPILDSVQNHVHDAREALSGTVLPYFQKVPWDPKIVIPIGAGLMLMAMVLLFRM